MDPLAPPHAPGHRVLTHVRAGALAAAGSLAGFAFAMFLDGFGVTQHGNGERVWFGSWLVSALLALRFGYRVAPKGAAALLGRARASALIGGALCVGYAVPAINLLPAPSRDLSAPVALLVAAVVLAALAARGLRPSARVEPDLDYRTPVIEPPVAPAGGLLPTAERAEPYEPGDRFALVGGGPALTAAETEGVGLVVEVRTLWGQDVLGFRHARPGRLALGDAGRNGPVVVSDAAGIAVLAPPDMAGSLQLESSERMSIMRALDEGHAAPVVGPSPSTRIPLVLGRRVTLTLGSQGGGHSYRAEPRQDVAGAPLVVEVALVRAGRVVGRELSMGGHGRFVASTVLAGVTVLGALRWSAASPLGSGDEPDEKGVSREQQYEITRGLIAVAEREMEDAEPLPVLRGLEGNMGELPRLPSDEVVWMTRGNTCHYRRATPYGYICVGGPWETDEFGQPAESPENPFDETPGSPFLAWYTEQKYPRAETDTVFARRLTWRVVTPFGLRGLATPGPDPLGRDAHDWRMFDEAAVRSPTASPATVHIGAVAVRGALRTDIVRRVVQQSHGRFRACYDRGLQRQPLLGGRVAVHFEIGADGVVSTVGNAGSTLADTEVVTCVANSYYGMNFPRSDAPSLVAEVPLFFSRGR
jgi:hypothetical protein